MSYTITDMSKRYNLPASTLRYYEKIGLLENVEHVNSRRFYNDSHIDRLNAIECFKKALLPLDEIRLFFAYEKDMEANAEKVLKMMKTQEAKTLESLEALQAGLEHLQKKIRFYTLVSEAVKNKTPLPSWDDFIVSSINLTLGTGDASCSASASGDINIKTDTGNISIQIGVE